MRRRQVEPSLSEEPHGVSPEVNIAISNGSFQVSGIFLQVRISAADRYANQEHD